MAAFDAQITLVGLNVQVIREGEGEDAPAYAAELGILIGLPVGPGQAVPFGQVRAPLTTEAVDDLIESLTEARSHMSKRPNIAIASSLDGIQQQAQFQQGLRG